MLLMKTVTPPAPSAYRRRDVARVLGCSVPQVCKFDRLGKLHPVHVPDSRMVIYDPAEVHALAESWFRGVREAEACA